MEQGVVSGGAMHQRKGVGSKLLEEAARWCSVEGINAIHLDVRAVNQEGIQFYTKAGFSVIRLRMFAPVVG